MLFSPGQVVKLYSVYNSITEKFFCIEQPDEKLKNISLKCYKLHKYWTLTVEYLTNKL